MWYQGSVITKRSSSDVHDPMTEVAATAGLLLMFVSVIGAVLGLAVFSGGAIVLATVVLVTALSSFIASLACFVFDARRLERAEVTLPFPSMLRR
ncbi:glucan phosphoethanolaminetransferase (alkaline phosphatase superfamily) [Mycolicibacterium sp. 624]